MLNNYFITKKSFYTFNSLIEEGRQIIISADKSPTDLEGIESRLKSRLGGGLVADIHPTDFDLRIGILNSKAKQMGLDLPPKVAEFLATKITSNIRELEGALNKLIAKASLTNSPITVPPHIKAPGTTIVNKL